MLSDPQWAGNLTSYQIVANSFLESLRNLSAFDRLLSEGMRVVPTGSRVIANTVAISGSAVAEKEPKPITALSLTSGDMEPMKAVAVVVVSDEIARAAGSAGMGFVSNGLRQGVAVATDRTFLSVLASAEAAIPSGGNTTADVSKDIAKMLEGVTTGSASRLFLVMPSLIAKRLSTMVGSDGRPAFDVSPQGGSLSGIPAIVSDGLADNEVVLVDAAQVVANPGTITLDATNQASLAMNSAPTGAMAASVSLWQLNLRAIRAERWFSFFGLDRSVAVLRPCAWGGA